MNAMSRPANGNHSDYERRLAAAESVRGMIPRDPSKPSLVDQLLAERRAEARAEDRADAAYRRGQARLRARAGR
jgi:hypothetical protein